MLFLPDVCGDLVYDTRCRYGKSAAWLTTPPKFGLLREDGVCNIFGHGGGAAQDDAGGDFVLCHVVGCEAFCAGIDQDQGCAQLVGQGTAAEAVGVVPSVGYDVAGE